MATLRIRKDLDEGIVEVDTGDGWRGLAPDAAHGMADTFEKAINNGERPDTSQTREFVNRLREYADDLEEQ